MKLAVDGVGCLLTQNWLIQKSWSPCTCWGISVEDPTPPPSRAAPVDVGRGALTIMAEPCGQGVEMSNHMTETVLSLR